VNAPDEVSYRLALAKGFLAEAEQDLTLERWRSCVDNSQLVVENVGKTALSVFGVPPKTHDPVRQIAAILREEELPQEIRLALQQMLPDLLALGTREHILTDYGDEDTFTLPWDLFTQESARDALQTARRCVQAVQELLTSVEAWRRGRENKAKGK
jgi:HEPN domain-containing protein